MSEDKKINISVDICNRVCRVFVNGKLMGIAEKFEFNVSETGCSMKAEYLVHGMKKYVPIEKQCSLCTNEADGEGGLCSDCDCSNDPPLPFEVRSG